MINVLGFGLLALSLTAAPQKDYVDVDVHHHHHHHVHARGGGPRVLHGTAEAFRTGGSAVAYGTRSVGRSIAGRPSDTHDRARMEHHAHRTGDDFRRH